MNDLPVAHPVPHRIVALEDASSFVARLVSSSIHHLEVTLEAAGGAAGAAVVRTA